MSLNENAQIDTSQVTDARGRSGGGFPVLLGGGGLLGTLLVLGMMLLNGGLGSLNGDTGPDAAIDQVCASGNPDRLNQRECRNTLYVNSIQNFWAKGLPQYLGRPYEQVDTVFFASAVNTGCGQADSGVGPFYCPEDRQVYIDLSFYDELATRFGAKGEFAQPYVLAHEYGHHVQTLTGVEAQVRRAQQRDPAGANALSVSMELQADCYAGVWANHAKETTDAAGNPIFKSITQQDVDQALEAAASIGDDKIQKQSTGRIDESKFTHGTSAQRQEWFGKGFSTGDPRECNTFGGEL